MDSLEAGLILAVDPSTIEIISLMLHIVLMGIYIGINLEEMSTVLLYNVFLGSVM